MELLQLKYFQKVAKLEHMTKAAEELHISQSSLSRTIKRLEDDLEVKLFERDGRDIRLNNYGAMFLERVERIFMELEEGRLEIKEKEGIENRTIRVGATITRLLPKLFKEFLELYPEVKFQLFQLHSKDVEIQLEEGKIDFAITTPMIEKKNIRSMALKKEKLFLAVSKEHPLASRRTINLNELSDQSFITLTSDYNFQNAIEKLCESRGFSPKIMFESNDIEVIFKLVLEGFGIAFMPAYWWDEDRKTLPVKIEIEEGISERVIAISWNEKHSLTKVAKEFKAFTTKYFQEVK